MLPSTRRGALGGEHAELGTHLELRIRASLMEFCQSSHQVCVYRSRIRGTLGYGRYRWKASVHLNASHIAMRVVY